MRCSCNRNNCILKNKNSYKQYRLQLEIIQEQNENDLCECGCGKKNSFLDDYDFEGKSKHLSFYTKSSIKKKNLYLMYKCEIIKYTDCILQEKNNLLLENNNKHNYILNIEKVSDEQLERIDNLESLATIMKKRYISHEKKYTEFKEKVNKDKTQLEFYKKENVNLRKLIVENVPINKKKEEKEESEEESEEEPIDSDYEDEINSNDINILNLHERLKKYLIKKQTNIYQISKNKNSNENFINYTCNKFINLRFVRNRIAHPKVNRINNDDEFLELLDRF
jgi:hypothetical protein